MDEIKLGSTGNPQLDALYASWQKRQEPQELDWPTFRDSVAQVKDTDSLDKYKTVQQVYFDKYLRPKIKDAASQVGLWDRFLKDTARPETGTALNRLKMFGADVARVGLDTAGVVTKMAEKVAAGIGGLSPTGIVTGQAGKAVDVINAKETPLVKSQINPAKELTEEYSAEQLQAIDAQGGSRLATAVQKFGAGIVGSAPAFAFLNAVVPMPGILRLGKDAKFSLAIHKDPRLLEAMVKGGLQVGTYEATVKEDVGAFPEGFATGAVLGAIDRASRGWLSFLKGKYGSGELGTPPAGPVTGAKGPSGVGPKPGVSPPTGQAPVTEEELQSLVKSMPREKQLSLQSEYLESLRQRMYGLPTEGTVTLTGKDKIDGLDIEFTNGQKVNIPKGLKGQEYTDAISNALIQGSPGEVKTISGEGRHINRYLNNFEARQRQVIENRLPVVADTPNPSAAAKQAQQLLNFGVEARAEGTQVVVPDRAQLDAALAKGKAESFEQLQRAAEQVKAAKETDVAELVKAPEAAKTGPVEFIASRDRVKQSYEELKQLLPTLPKAQQEGATARLRQMEQTLGIQVAPTASTIQSADPELTKKLSQNIVVLDFNKPAAPEAAPIKPRVADQALEEQQLYDTYEENKLKPGQRVRFEAQKGGLSGYQRDELGNERPIFSTQLPSATPPLPPNEVMPESGTSISQQEPLKVSVQKPRNYAANTTRVQGTDRMLGGAYRHLSISGSMRQIADLFGTKPGDIGGVFGAPGTNLPRDLGHPELNKLPVVMATSGAGKYTPFHEINHELFYLNPILQKEIRDQPDRLYGLMKAADMLGEDWNDILNEELNFTQVVKNQQSVQGSGKFLGEIYNEIVSKLGRSTNYPPPLAREETLVRVWSAFRALGTENNNDAQHEIVQLVKMDTDLADVVELGRQSVNWALQYLSREEPSIARSMLTKHLNKAKARLEPSQLLTHWGSLILDTSSPRVTERGTWELTDTRTGDPIEFESPAKLMQWLDERMPSAAQPELLGRLEKEYALNGMELASPFHPDSVPVGEEPKTFQILPAFSRKFTRAELLGRGPGAIQRKQPTKERQLPVDPGWTELTSWIQPAAAWFNAVEQQTGVPVFRDVFNKLDKGMLQQQLWLQDKVEFLQNRLMRVDRAKLVAYSHYDEAKGEVAKAEVARANWFTKQDFEVMREGRGHYERAFKDLGIGDYAPWVEDFQPRVRRAAEYKLSQQEGRPPRDPWSEPGPAKEIRFFSKYKRIRPDVEEASMEDNYATRFWSYMRLGAREHFMGEAWEQALAVHKDPRLTEGLRTPIGNYMKFVYGSTDQSFITMKNAWSAITKSLPFGDKLEKVTLNKMILLMYSSGLGFKPALILRDVLQGFLTSYPHLGERWWSYGLTQALKPERWELARSHGALIPMHQSPVFEGVEEPGMVSKVAETSLWTSSIGNNLARVATFSAAYQRAQTAIRTFRADRNLDNFLQDSGAEILLKGQANDIVVRALDVDVPVEDSAGLLARYYTEATQWPFRKGNAPRWAQYKAGRVLGMYGQWPAHWLQYMLRSVSQGSVGHRLAFGARSFAANAITQGLFNSAGIDASRWLWSNPGDYTFSPTAHGVANVMAAPGTGPTGQQARAAIWSSAGGLTQITPGWSQLMNMLKALDSPNPLLGLLGFKPLKEKK